MNPLTPHKAVIREIRRETADVSTYVLETDATFAGEEIRPGQFSMLGFPGTGEAAISFSGFGTNGLIEHTIRAVGGVTGFLSGMTSGKGILTRGPYGNGWPMKSLAGSDVLLVAGGVGLAPLRPVILEILRNRKSYREVALLYGSRNEKSLLFVNEYERWAKSFPVHLTVDELVSGRPWAHSVGLITGLLEKVTIDPVKTIALICGPELMMRFTARALALKGLSFPRIFVSLERRMKCGIAHCGHCQHGGLFVCKDGPVFPYTRVSGLFDGLL